MVNAVKVFKKTAPNGKFTSLFNDDNWNDSDNGDDGDNTDDIDYKANGKVIMMI